MCRVSIVVPVYNAAEFLHHCIDSIRKQTYRDFELILVDDGSRDHSGDLCDKYAKEASIWGIPIYVIHQSNKGVSSARNVGIAKANGDFIVFIDSDDYVEPDYLGKLIDTRDRYPNAGHIWCGYQKVSDYHRSMAKKCYIEQDSEITVYDRRDYMKLFIACTTQGPYCKLFDTAILKQMRFDITLSLGEDLLFNLEYLNRIEDTSIIFINQALYNYFQGGESTLGNKYREDLFEIYHKIDVELKSRLQNWNISEKSWILFYDSAYYHTINALRNTFHKANKMKFPEKIKRNDKMLEDKLFQESLEKTGVYINPFYRKTLKTGKYFYVWLFEQLDQIKKSLRH